MSSCRPKAAVPGNWARMTATDPKATLGPSAWNVRYCSQQLLNPNQIGVNASPATKINKVPLHWVVFHFLGMGRDL